VRFDVHRLKERLVKLAQLAQLAQLVLAQYQLVEAKEACPGEENLWDYFKAGTQDVITVASEEPFFYTPSSTLSGLWGTKSDRLEFLKSISGSALEAPEQDATILKSHQLTKNYVHTLGWSFLGPYVEGVLGPFHTLKIS
jgi:hypothetical protein